MVSETFQLVAKLRGHTGNINSLAFSSKGDLLASGGDDESVRIWDVANHRCHQILHDPAGRWGQITTIQWVTHTTSGNTLYFGTGRGMVLFYQEKKPATALREIFSGVVFDEVSVEAIAHDPVNGKLAITSHNGDIQMWHSKKNGEWKRVWRTRMSEATILRGVRFVDHYTCITVFKLETGDVIWIDAESGKQTRTAQLQSSIGHVSFCGELILVDNLRDGFDVYDLERPYPTRSFSIPTSKYVVRQGVFADAMRLAICGSDHGKVYIFDVRTSQLVETLRHGEADTFVHAVESFRDRSSGLTLIASGPLKQAKPEICLWEQKTILNVKQDKTGKVVRLDHHVTASGISTFQMAVNVCVLLAILCFILESDRFDDLRWWIYTLCYTRIWRG